MDTPGRTQPHSVAKAASQAPYRPATGVFEDPKKAASLLGPTSPERLAPKRQRLGPAEGTTQPSQSTVQPLQTQQQQQQQLLHTPVPSARKLDFSCSLPDSQAVRSAYQAASSQEGKSSVVPAVAAQAKFQQPVPDLLSQASASSDATHIQNAERCRMPARVQIAAHSASELNDQQWAAVHADPYKPCLISAGTLHS